MAIAMIGTLVVYGLPIWVAVLPIINAVVILSTILRIISFIVWRKQSRTQKS
jgi:hypothetical protein